MIVQIMDTKDSRIYRSKTRPIKIPELINRRYARYISGVAAL